MNCCLFHKDIIKWHGHLQGLLRKINHWIIVIMIPLHPIQMHKVLFHVCETHWALNYFQCKPIRINTRGSEDLHNET